MQILESLHRFGLTPASRHLLIASLDSGSELEPALKDLIQGHWEDSVDRLPSLSDHDLLKKAGEERGSDASCRACRAARPKPQTGDGRAADKLLGGTCCWFVVQLKPCLTDARGCPVCVQYYKFSDAELEIGSREDAIVTRMAARDMA